MRLRLLGLVLAVGMTMGMASKADAQFALSIGNPYSGGIYTGVPAYGYGYGSPGVFNYSSGYGGFAQPYGYGYGGAYGVRSYGFNTYRPVYGGGVYRPYYNNYRRGFGPFRGGYRRW